MEFSRKRTCLRCPVCEEAFGDVVSLERHLSSCQRDATPLRHRRKGFTCCQVICYKYVTCAQRFSQLEELTKHMTTHSSSKLIYVCSTCDAEFLSISQLKEHVAVNCRDVWWKQVEIRGVQQVRGETFSDDLRVIEEIKTEEEDWIDRQDFNSCGSVGEMDSGVVAAAVRSGWVGERPGDVTLHSPEGVGGPTIHQEMIQENCEQVKIYTNLIMYPDSNGDMRYEFVSNECIEVLEESARNLKSQQEDVPSIVMYLDPSGNVKHQNVTKESVMRLQKKSTDSNSRSVPRNDMVFYLSESGNMKFLKMTCKSFETLKKKSLDTGLLLEPSENVLMYLDSDGNLRYLNVMNESAETVRRIGSSAWMKEIVAPYVVLFFNEGCGIQCQEVLRDYLKPLFKVKDCVREPRGPNDNVVLYFGANGNVRCLQVSRDVMKLLNQNYNSQQSSRSTGFCSYVRQIADGRGIQRNVTETLRVPRLQLNDVRKYLDEEGRLSKEKYQQLKCDLKNELKKLKRPKKPTVPCELFLGMDRGVRVQNCTSDKIQGRKSACETMRGKDLSIKESAKNARSDQMNAKELTSDARTIIICDKECATQSSSDQKSTKELTTDEITAKYLRHDMKRAKKIIRERMRAQNNVSDSLSAPQDTTQTTVSVIRTFNKKRSYFGHGKAIGDGSLELINNSSQEDPTDDANEQVTSNSKTQVEEGDTAQIDNTKEPMKMSRIQDTDIIVLPNASKKRYPRERSNVVLLQDTRNVLVKHDNGNIILVQNSNNQVVLQDRSNLRFVPNGNNKLVLPDKSNLVFVPNARNQKIPSDKSNLVLVPNISNQGMVPNGNNLVLVPNLNNPGMVPGGSNVVLMPNVSKQGIVPDRDNVVFIPNINNQTMQPNNVALVPNASNQIVQQDKVNALTNKKNQILPQILPDKSIKTMLQSTEDKRVPADRDNVSILNDTVKGNIEENTDDVSVVLHTNNGVVQPTRPHFKSDTSTKEVLCDKTKRTQKTTLEISKQQQAIPLSPEMPMPLVKEVAARLKMKSPQKTLSSSLRCFLCGRYFQNIWKLNQHMKCHPGRSVVYRCSVCAFGYLEMEDLLLHISVHAQGKTIGDLQVFQQMNSQQRLMKSAALSGRMRYRCCTCGEEFSEVLTLVNHKNTHKEDFGIIDMEGSSDDADVMPRESMVEPFSVPVLGASSEEMPKEACESLPATTTDIEITFEKMGSASFKCAICNRMFYVLSDLEEHLKMHNNQKLVYKCTLCSSCFQDLPDFKKHLKMHTIEDMKKSLLKKPPPLSLLVPWRKNSVVQSSSIVTTTPPAGDEALPPPDFHDAAMRPEKYRPRYECCVCDDAFEIVLKHLKHDKFHTKVLQDVYERQVKEANKIVTDSEDVENEVLCIDAPVDDRCTTGKKDTSALKHRMRYECLVCDSVFQTLAAWGHEQLHDDVLSYALHTPSLSTMIAYLMPHLDHEYTSNQTSNQDPTPALKAQLQKIQFDLQNYASSLPAMLPATKKLSNDTQKKPPPSLPKEKASAPKSMGSSSGSQCIDRRETEKEKPDNVTYLCENCGKSCSYKSLARHRLLHSKSASFPCPICPRMFKLVESLVGHMVTHTGMDPRVCKVCRLGFVNEKDQREHSENGGCQRYRRGRVRGARKERETNMVGYELTMEGRDSTAVNAASEIMEEMKQAGREQPISLLQTDGVPMQQIKVNYLNFMKYTCNVCREELPNMNMMKMHIMQSHCDNVNLRCDPCKLTFKSKKKLLSHQKIHLLKVPYKCANCSEAFSTVTALKSHIDDHNREGGNYLYECSICKEQLADLQALALHKELHVNVGSGCLFECNLCNIQLEDLTDLEGHKDIHAGLNEVCVFECTLCSQKMREFVDLETHKAIHSCENSIYAFQCNICEEHFMDPSDLEAHREVHVDINQPCACECNVCKEQFMSTKKLEEHVLEVHAKKAHLCDICGKVYHNIVALKRHKRSHQPVSFPCETCDKTFQKRAALRQHMYTHSEKMFLCDFCPRTFARSTRLKAHRLSHTREAVIKCDKCDKEFTDRKMLRYHMLRHDGKRPYECDICSKRFYSSSSAAVHRRVHFPDRPYKCTVCKKSFREKYFLQCHIRKHGLPPYTCDICGTGFAYKNLLEQHKFSH